MRGLVITNNPDRAGFWQVAGIYIDILLAAGKRNIR